MDDGPRTRFPHSEFREVKVKDGKKRIKLVQNERRVIFKTSHLHHRRGLVLKFTLFSLKCFNLSGRAGVL